MNKGLKDLLKYSVAVLLISIVYYVYVATVQPVSPERETYLTEIGEGFGEVALWAFVVIYLRTALKLIMGKGPLSRRLLPDYSAPPALTYLQRIVSYLDRSHVYVGVAAIALVLIHIALMGGPVKYFV